MPFRASYSCLWCGTDHTTRSADDLEGWAQLCPACVGKAGDNQFLRPNAALFGPFDRLEIHTDDVTGF